MDLRDCKQEHKELITERLDPDFGLLDELLASRSLTRPEVAKVKAVSDSYGRSEKLLEYFFDRHIYEKFLTALRKTQQTHLANYIFSNGERRPEFGEDWPLTEREISILDTNQRSLVDLLETCDLLLHLYSRNVVNNRQRDFVLSKTACYEKNEALLEILRRTSLKNYTRMIYCLHLSKQRHIAKIFEEGGEVVRVRSELETETDVNDVEDELITKFTEMLGDHSLGDSARILECTQLRLIAAKQGNSIILYFFCKTSAELDNLQEMQTSGKLANVVREMFNEMLSRPQVINLRTTLYDKDFSKCELGFRNVVAKGELKESCEEDDESDVSNTTMHDLPLELLDMILEKVYGHSSVIRNQLFQPTDEEIICSMASVDFCWFQRVIRRRFKNVIWRNLTVFYRKYYKRRIICRNTRLYLVENIQTKGMSKQLRSVDCLTDIQTRLANRGQDKSGALNRKNEDLLHLAKSLDDSRYSAFVRCLRESKQTLCAEVVTNGGVVLKAEIQCSHLKNRKSAEQQMVKPLNDLRDKTRSRPAPLEQQLNRLKAENIEILHSLLDRNPVVWLWCHSESGLTKLQTDSDLVLKLLNLETIARPSEIFNAKTVNIDSDRFKKEVGEIYLRDRIEAHKELITDRLDPDFGLLDELFASRSLTRSEVAEFKAISHSYGRSEKLLEYVFYKSFYEKFLDALRRTQQTHLANFILSNGERRPEFGDYWPLTEREISILDTNQRTLIDLLDISDLLPLLYSHEVANNQQGDFVSSRTTSHEKNEALLDILRRTSLQNYKATIDCLPLSNQRHIARLFEESSSGDITREELDAMTTCCICTEVYIDPKALPCIHTFCMKCLQEYGLKTNKGPGDEMPCPICRRLFKIPSEGFRGLPKNFFIDRLIQVSKVSDPSAVTKALCSVCLEESKAQEGKEIPTAVTYCVECKHKLCEECWNVHRKFKLTKNHKLMPIDEYESGQNVVGDLAHMVCEIHEQKVLDVYCADCKTVVCAICFIEYHNNHKGSHVSECVDGFRKEIQNSTEAMTGCVAQAQVKKAELLKFTGEMQQRVESLECDVEKRKDEIKQLTEKHANSLLHDLCSERQSRLKEIQMATDDIDDYLLNLESYNSYCQRLIDKGSASDICRTVSDLSIRAFQLEQQCQPKNERRIPDFRFCFRQSELEEFLEEDCDNLVGEIEEEGDPKPKKRSKQSLLVDKLKQELQAEKTTNNSLQANNCKLVEELNLTLYKATVTSLEANAEKLRKELETTKTDNNEKILIIEQQRRAWMKEKEQLSKQIQERHRLTVSSDRFCACIILLAAICIVIGVAMWMHEEAVPVKKAVPVASSCLLM